MIRRTLLILAALVAAFPALISPALAEDPAKLAGVWKGEGYGCYDAKGALIPSYEQVRISYKDGVLIAVKIDRTPCPGLGEAARRAGVPSGEISWRSKIPGGSFAYDQAYAAESHLASPTGRLLWAPGQVTIKSDDEIVWLTPSAAGKQPIIFRRGGPAPIS
ncbi:MAG: hypothetical protein MRY74_04325 [Neomegalonema sp.]|nr:hypothetical protein [Neomegalonema sp.]